MAVYGYCRVSTSTQRIERQESNIKEKYPEAVIYKEAFTGTKLQGRKELDKIFRKVNPGDFINVRMHLIRSKPAAAIHKTM